MINAAIVGLGGWARVLVNSVQGKSDKIRFTAGMTRTVSKAADYAAEKGFPLSDDYAEILADPAIDAVVLSTPHSQHAEQIVQASAAGKHVFVEKPFTLTKVSAEESVAAADAAGVVLALGHNRRFMPSWTELKNRIDSGSLGTIMHVETNMSGLGALSFQTGGWRADRAESPAGGMAGMLNTVWLIICALSFGAVMQAAGFLERITIAILSGVKSTFSLVASTAGSSLMFNVIAADQYIAIVVPGNMYRTAYEEKGLPPELLSRTLEDAGTVTSVLIPWNTCGVAQAGVLGVATSVYAPFAVFNYLSPIMSLIVAAFGIGMKKR